MYEFFRILQQFHSFYKLNILSEWYITDIFHISNFIKATDSKQLPLTEQRNPLPESAVINNENQAEWVFKKILNSQYSELSHHFQYKVCWSDYDSDSTWYNTDSNEFQNISEVLHKYHVWYFNKLNLQFIELKLICHQSTRADQKEIQNTVSEVILDSLLLLYWI